MNHTARPLVLFSLPRSGSTLLQRMLAAHPRIASTAEPWLLIPHLYALRDAGVTAEYRHRTLVRALEDFCEELPDGRETYLRELRRFALALYSEAAGPEAAFFVDKTPRYALVADDVLSLLPDGKFVFLWRNPLAAAASMVETWYDGKWRLRSRRRDLFESLANLVRAREAAGERALAVRFEDLLSDPEAELGHICEYLGLPYDARMLRDFSSVSFRGRLGDPSGSVQYTAVSTEPLTKWRRAFCNPLRKRWGRKYLKWIGPDRLRAMGYEPDALLAELDEIPGGVRRLAGDLFELARVGLRSGLGIEGRNRRLRSSRQQ
jgi:hypothetical protein